LKEIDFEFYYGFDAPLNFVGLKYVSDIPKSFFVDNKIDYEYVKRWSIGQLGAYFSIRELIQNAYSNGFNRVLIFEDDIVTDSVDFTKDINLALFNLPEKWDILKLGYEYDGRFYKYAYKRRYRMFLIAFNFLKKLFNMKHVVSLPKRVNTQIDKAGNSFGGHAFILNRSGLNKLLENMYPLREGGDVLINSMITENQIEAFSIYPILFRQLNKNDSSTR
jgi:GR25 family glycosyltransferase involved in LPS biosynthesis